jgi:hypothetical protein
MGDAGGQRGQGRQPCLPGRPVPQGEDLRLPVPKSLGHLLNEGGDHCLHENEVVAEEVASLWGSK